MTTEPKYTDAQISLLVTECEHGPSQAAVRHKTIARVLRSLLTERQAAMQGQDGEPVAWRFWIEDGHEFNPFWTGWSSDKASLELHQKRGFTKVEYAYPPPQPVRSVSEDECPACHKNWGEHRSGYYAAQCKMKPQKKVVRSVSDEDVDGAEDAYNEISVTNSCNRKALRAALEHFAKSHDVAGAVKCTREMAEAALNAPDSDDAIEAMMHAVDAALEHFAAIAQEKKS